MSGRALKRRWPGSLKTSRWRGHLARAAPERGRRPHAARNVSRGAKLVDWKAAVDRRCASIRAGPASAG